MLSASSPAGRTHQDTYACQYRTTKFSEDVLLQMSRQFVVRYFRSSSKVREGFMKVVPVDSRGRYVAETHARFRSLSCCVSI